MLIDQKYLLYENNMPFWAYSLFPQVYLIQLYMSEDNPLLKKQKNMLKISIF